MSEFNIERLREAVAWAEREAVKPKSKSRWRQTLWMKGRAGKRTRALSRLKLPEWMDGAIEVREIKCGSAYCVAGNVCAAEGDVFVAVRFDWQEPGQPEAEEYAENVIPKGSNELHEVRTRARELLGITASEATNLFEADNSIEDIRRIAKRIAKKRGETL